MTTERRNPWTYVPLMYFLQAIPVALVQEVATVVYKDLGVANESITRWTSIVALPWSLQMFFGPLVDLTKTRREWVVRAQLVITAALALVPFLLKLPNAFELSLGALFTAAVFSTLCNAAMDGYYLLSLNREDQARFAGIQGTFYRLGTLFAKGLLVFVAGKLMHVMSPQNAWATVLLGGAAVYGGLYLVERAFIPRPVEDVQAPDAPGEVARNVGRTAAVVGLGVSAYFAANAVVRLAAHALAHSALPDMKGWLLKPNGALLGFEIPGPGATAEGLQLLFAGALALAFATLARREIRATPMGDAFGSFFRQKGIVAVLAFLMFYRFGEAMIMKMSPLFLKDAPAAGGLGLGTDDVGTIKGVVGVFGIVLGGILGGWIVSRAGLRRSIWPLAVCMHLPGLLYLWASHALPPSR